MAKGQPVTFVSLHAGLQADERAENAQRLVAGLGANVSQAVVCGDFNERPGESIGDRLTGAGLVDTYRERHPNADGFTIPVDEPTRRIDFIYRPKAWKPTRHAWVPVTTASDHLPVGAVLPFR